MTEIEFYINLQIGFDDVPEELAALFIERGERQQKLDREIEVVIETFIRDYHRSFFDSHNLHDQAVKDLFTKTSGADPKANIEHCEEI